MNEQEWKNEWKAYQQKLDQTLAYNKIMVEQITQNKMNQLLNQTKPMKYVGIALGIFWVLFLDTLVVVGFLSGGISFPVSLLILSILYKIAIGTYLYHLYLIRQVNQTTAVMEAQRPLAQLKTSTITILRIMVLQLPFWTTWYLNPMLPFYSNVGYWVINLMITGLFTFAAIWLYRNIRWDQSSSGWLKFLMEDREWLNIQKASQLLEEFKQLETK